MDGIKSFYSKFKDYLEKNLVLESNLSPCNCSKIDGYSELYISSYIPIPIDVVWKEVFVALPEGNAFSKFLEDQGCKGNFIFN
jgi:hypothetical protein